MRQIISKYKPELLRGNNIQAEVDLKEKHIVDIQQRITDLCYTESAKDTIINQIEELKEVHKLET